ncbi:fatty acyl-CoA reductase wat-like [Ceratina calcarata]|uniref:Fatty acyl-CoA reductase n=1 Tax=Ceratina calcarata TaxID=156304 RepID=A0AAJ7WF17_9HYME|nr:fatty acyl-CoA reductase wat-like [Ceratina calcarata]XP_026673910.1 fatty acyl-CoA reductase wat-like [Ceratina calcarata]XP_026673911.1 fatty acyl-CoA reductase wat-like [Ceratina calcarata]XP_026673912.1 fatty acyl-CoA reductase wat-like [Ceratina calcarata]XP_026673913.1 fatty acyl-CoA reductase wat-like [Ceratina calcarata]XP_026673914.1 fatty acyl-CoA reductase wat-like [Ceratina calcarata]
MSSDYVNDLLDFSEAPSLSEKSEIIAFFNNATVLVTGGTGFLGKLLIEKLLRSCPGITKLYMIVRPKKGKTAEERFKENFSEIIYDPLKKEQPNFLNKIVMLEGDASKENYGLSEEDKSLVMTANVIFHAAAVVRFDEKIRTVTNTNVRSTKFILKLAKEMPNLKAFVYVSTAFSQCTEKVINEIHYKNIMDADKVLALVDIIDDDKKLEQITPTLIDKWPNTYVYTKALAENMILKHSEDLPVCIVRPSIVISTYKEPIAAWTNNLYGATGVVIGSGVGLLRTLHCYPDNISEIVPADYVIANIIAAAWDTAKRKASLTPAEFSNLKDEEKIPIYNYVSSCQNPIHWGLFMKLNSTIGVTVPPINAIWYYMLILNKYLFVHNVSAFFLHTIPAIIMDGLAYLTGRKPMLLDAYRKIHKFSHVISFFCTNQWSFRDNNVVKLWERMNPADQEIFHFNIKALDWEDYFLVHIKGLRVYMLKDPMDTLEPARAKYKKLKIAHYTILILGSLLLLWTVGQFLCYLWSFF